MPGRSIHSEMAERITDLVVFMEVRNVGLTEAEAGRKGSKLQTRLLVPSGSVTNPPCRCAVSHNRKTNNISRTCSRRSTRTSRRAATRWASWWDQQAASPAAPTRVPQTYAALLLILVLKASYYLAWAMPWRVLPKSSTPVEPADRAAEQCPQPDNWTQQKQRNTITRTLSTNTKSKAQQSLVKCVKEPRNFEHEWATE